MDPDGPPVELRPRARLLVSSPAGRRWHRLDGAQIETGLPTHCGRFLDPLTAVDADYLGAGSGRQLCARCWPQPSPDHGALGHLFYWDDRLQVIRPDGQMSIEGRLSVVDVEAGVRSAFDVRVVRSSDGPPPVLGSSFAPLEWWAAQMTDADVLGIHITTAPGVAGSSDLVRLGVRSASTRTTVKAVLVMALISMERPVTTTEAGELLGWGAERAERPDRRDAMLEEVAREALGLRDLPALGRGHVGPKVRSIFRSYHGRNAAQGYERQLVMAARAREKQLAE